MMDASGSETRGLDAGYGDALRELTEALPQELRQPIELRFGLGLTRAEVAQILACPKGAVSSWIREGLGRLRRSFEARGVTLSAAAIGELARASLAEACAAQNPPPCPSLARLRSLAGGRESSFAWSVKSGELM